MQTVAKANDSQKEGGDKNTSECIEMTKCEICGKDGVALLRANHRDLGIIRICNECWENEWYNLLPSGSGCCYG